MVLDNTSVHRPNQELISHAGNIRVMFLPPNCTALIQMMEQNMIQCVKVTYRKRLLQELPLQEEAVFAIAESKVG